MRVILFILGFCPLLLTGQSASFSWHPFSIGSPPLSLTLPGVALPQKAVLPKHVVERIKRYDAYYLKDQANGIVVTIMHVTYTDDITADIQGAADGTVAQWEHTGSRVDILNTTHLKIDGKTALRQTGIYFSDGLKNEYTSIVIGEENRLWQVIVIIRASDDALQKAVTKLIQSITFK